MHTVCVCATIVCNCYPLARATTVKTPRKLHLHASVYMYYTTTGVCVCVFTNTDICLMQLFIAMCFRKLLSPSANAHVLYPCHIERFQREKKMEIAIILRSVLSIIIQYTRYAILQQVHYFKIKNLRISFVFFVILPNLVLKLNYNESSSAFLHQQQQFFKDNKKKSNCYSWLV